MCFPLQKKSCPARYIYQKGHSTSSRVGTKKWLSNNHGWLYHGAKKPMSCFHNFCQLQLLKPGRFATDFYSKPWFRQTNWNSLPFQENEWMCPRMLPSHVLLVRGEIPVFWGTWCTWMVMMLLEKLKMQYQELLVLFVCTLAIPWVALNNKKNYCYCLMGFTEKLFGAVFKPIQAHKSLSNCTYICLYIWKSFPNFRNKHRMNIFTKPPHTNTLCGFGPFNMQIVRFHQCFRF